MGLDQNLFLDITTTRESYPMNLAQQYLKDLNGYLKNAGYQAQLNYHDDSTYDCEPVYDIDGHLLAGQYDFVNSNIQENFHKVNQIQKYFEDKFYTNNPQTQYDCVNTVLDDIDIESLIDRLNKINQQPTTLGKIKYAKKLLPTTEGFFYGSTDYDEDYFSENQRFGQALSDLQHRRNQIDHLLANTPFTVELVYLSWW